MIRFYFLLVFLSIHCALAQLPSGNVLYLDGDGDYVMLSAKVIQTRQFTIEAWANMFARGGGRYGQNPVFQQRDDLTQWGGKSTIVFLPQNKADVTMFCVRSSDSLLQCIREPAPKYGEWHYYAAVVDNNSLFLYIDGELVASTRTLQTGDYITSIDYIDIGRHRYLQTDVGFFNGAIDELRIWNYARSKRQLLTTFSDTLEKKYYASPDSGLLAYYRFDHYQVTNVSGKADTTIQDLSWQHISGKLMGNAQLISSQPTVQNLHSFELASPKNDETIFTLGVTLSWDSATDGPIFYPNEITYFVLLDSVQIFSHPRIFPVQRDTGLSLPSLIPGTTYFWKVLAKNIAGDSLWSANANAFFVSHTATGIERENILLPRNNLFSQNYPNPFNPGTEINYELQASGQVQIKIYDLTGRLVKVIANATQPAGAHSAQWDGTDFQGTPVAAGIYIYRIEFVGTNGKKMVQSKKMSLVK